LDEDEGTEWPINKNVPCAVQKLGLLSVSRFLRFVYDKVVLNCRYVNNCKIKGNKKESYPQQRDKK